MPCFIANILLLPLLPNESSCMGPDALLQMNLLKSRSAARIPLIRLSQAVWSCPDSAAPWDLNVLIKQQQSACTSTGEPHGELVVNGNVGGHNKWQDAGGRHQCRRGKRAGQQQVCFQAQGSPSRRQAQQQQQQPSDSEQHHQR